jgi:hypothetical protein
MEPLAALSRFFYLCGFLLIPVTWALVALCRRYCERQYDLRAPEAGTEEILAELEREFAPVRRATIRTQTEYLPFLLESIRENIDSGFEDRQVRALLERIELHRPGDERCATFTVMSGRRRSEVHLSWVRDSCDRICLRVRGAPRIVGALRAHQRRIPRAVV